MSCGITYFFEILTVWKPVYWLSAAAKIITAVASVGAAGVLFVAAGDIIAFVLTARQLGTRRGDEKFRALFNAAPLAVLSLDLEGLVTSWSPGAEKIFGFAERDVIGQPLPIISAVFREEHRKVRGRAEPASRQLPQGAAFLPKPFSLIAGNLQNWSLCARCNPSTKSG